MHILILNSGKFLQRVAISLESKRLRIFHVPICTPLYIILFFKIIFVLMSTSQQATFALSCQISIMYK